MLESGKSHTQSVWKIQIHYPQNRGHTVACELKLKLRAGLVLTHTLIYCCARQIWKNEQGWQVKTTDNTNHKEYPLANQINHRQVIHLQQIQLLEKTAKFQQKHNFTKKYQKITKKSPKNYSKSLETAFKITNHSQNPSKKFFSAQLSPQCNLKHRQ